MLLYPMTGGYGLGPLEPWHAEEFARSVAEARDHLAPWVPFAHTITDSDRARAFLQRFANDRATDSRHLYGIWRDGQLEGGVMFLSFDVRTGVCAIGVWLSPQAQGRGVMSEAARHLIDWAIRTRGMARVEWGTDPRNVRSVALARRLGFTFEGIHRSSHVVADERQDTELWAVLAQDRTPRSAVDGVGPLE